MLADCCAGRQGAAAAMLPARSAECLEGGLVCVVSKPPAAAAAAAAGATADAVAAAAAVAGMEAAIRSGSDLQLQQLAVWWVADCCGMPVT